MNIFIGGAWPYANGSLHIGQIAGLLNGDIIARYYRIKGDKVCYVSGSDCYGTPISLRAKKEGIKPDDIVNRYHSEFVECFKKLGFSYDIYSKTIDKNHEELVNSFLDIINKNGYLYEKSDELPFCNNCNRFLPDRFLKGICYVCGKDTRGDQCDYCGTVIEVTKIKEISCSICGTKPNFKETKHLFFRLSDFKNFLIDYIENHDEWRINAINNSKKYIEEGLYDRAITRDLDWGIDSSIEGFRDKKIYVWFEAVLGYISATKEYCRRNDINFNEYWKNKDSIHYYVHGKDNIPFHTIIFPSLLKAHGGYKLPDRIISNEYLTLEGEKISTSKNWAIWVPYIINKYNPDSIRYFLTINGPEKRDTDFSWREFVNSNNSELLGAYGNFINRTIVFIKKYYENKIPESFVDNEIKSNTEKLYKDVGILIERGNTKESLEKIFKFVRNANKYFDTQKPWIDIEKDKIKCNNTIYNCIQIIGNLSNLLEPFIPFSSTKVKKSLGIKNAGWRYLDIKNNVKIKDLDILFNRIDKKTINEEINYLKKYF